MSNEEDRGKASTANLISLKELNQLYSSGSENNYQGGLRNSSAEETNERMTNETVTPTEHKQHVYFVVYFYIHLLNNIHKFVQLNSSIGPSMYRHYSMESPKWK